MQKVRGHLHSDSTPSWPTDHVADVSAAGDEAQVSGATTDGQHPAAVALAGDGQPLAELRSVVAGCWGCPA